MGTWQGCAGVQGPDGGAGVLPHQGFRNISSWAGTKGEVKEIHMRESMILAKNEMHFSEGAKGKSQHLLLTL